MAASLGPTASEAPPVAASGGGLCWFRGRFYKKQVKDVKA